MSDANWADSFFAEMAKRPSYRVLTPEVLAEIPDENLEVAIYDIVWAARVESWEQFLQLLASLTPAYRYVHATIRLEADVGNGGFNQYFYNHGNRLLDDVLGGYQAMGLGDIAQLVEAAGWKYAHEAKDDDKAKLLQSCRLSDFFKSYEHSQLGSLDERLWDAAPRIAAQRIAYIRGNTEQFSGDFRHLYE
jgi:hypothetical protein